MTDTIAAIATPPGKSAVGIVRLSGPEAKQTALAIFLPESELSHRRMTIGTLTGADSVPIDRCMAVYFKAPESYTGEDVIEFHCHGSLPVLNEAMRALTLAGARQARAGEFTKRALLNGKLDLLAAEAVGALIASETEEAAKNAAAQIEGVLTREISAVYDQIIEVLSHFQAVVDYPEEDIAAFEAASAAEILMGAARRLKALEQGFERGRVMTEGVPTALIGRPNVGKSSLLNAITGTDRAIVTTLAGTTRDIVETRVRMGGVMLRLMDTAGIRRARDEAEAAGIRKTLSAAREAALILLVIDASSPLLDEDMQAIDTALNRPSIVVLNKSDLPQKVSAQDFHGDFGYVVEVSAETGEGLSGIDAAIREIFNTEGLRFDGTLLVSERQKNACETAALTLSRAIDALKSGEAPDMALSDVEAAAALIGELLGKSAGPDILEKIFENFCVGK